MRAIRCLIVDDEPLAHRVIENFARDLRFLQIVRKCRNAMEAREALHEEERIDLIFLDIQMPKLTGLAFMRSLQHPPLVIFTTAYADHALESYELEAVDYLKKPFSFERFSQALEKAQRRLAVEESTSPWGTGASATANKLESAAAPTIDLNSHLFLKTDGETVRVDVGEIEVIESLGDYVKVSTSRRAVTNHDTLANWQKRLPDSAFVRVHKSFIVALAKIDSIRSGELTIGNRRVPVGRVYRQALDERLSGA